MQATTVESRLVAAVENSTESIVVTDPTGTITYVNPAFEQVTGYRAEEVVGQNPRILQSGRQTPGFYEDLWSTITGGRTWHGELVNRRRDGSLYVEEASISPIVDATGSITSYVAVKRDVTATRDLGARLDRLDAERTYLTAALSDLQPHESARVTAKAICERVVGFPGIALAVISMFVGADEATMLAYATVDGEPLDPAPVETIWDDNLRMRVRVRHARAAQGGWIEAARTIPGHPLAPAHKSIGITAHATLPVSLDGSVVGLLTASTAAANGEEILAQRMSSLAEFASLASIMLGRQVVVERGVRARREAIQARIDQCAYRTVFQPIEELGTRTVVGYEALTRFDDGLSPAEVFAEADAVGLGEALEIATLRTALESAGPLPANRFIDLNVSPGLILAGEPIRSLLADSGFGAILEVTEHARIVDYGAFRDAVTALGPSIQLAVDDAGSGFASLRHMLELHPSIVKIDRALVTSIDEDPARQALTTGLVAFAETTGCTLVAEGIETEAELETLRAIGVHHGQGFLLAPPVPATELPEARPPSNPGRWDVSRPMTTTVPGSIYPRLTNARMPAPVARRGRRNDAPPRGPGDVAIRPVA